MTKELKQVLTRIREETPEFADGAEVVASVMKTLRQQGRLPERLPAKTQTSVEKPRDFVAETYAILENLREPTDEERKILEKNGFTYFTTIQAKSLDQVLAENPEYLWYVNSSQSLRVYTPSKDFAVCFNPVKACIGGSINCSQIKQLEMIEEFAKSQIENLVPGAKAVMLPATGYAQADIEHQKQNNGKVLLPDFWARALDTTFDPFVAHVGRSRPDHGLNVRDWRRDLGLHGLWAVPAVVFLRN